MVFRSSDCAVGSRNHGRALHAEYARGARRNGEARASVVDFVGARERSRKRDGGARVGARVDERDPSRWSGSFASGVVAESRCAHLLLLGGASSASGATFSLPLSAPANACLMSICRMVKADGSATGRPAEEDRRRSRPSCACGRCARLCACARLSRAFERARQAVVRLFGHGVSS